MAQLYLNGADAHDTNKYNPYAIRRNRGRRRIAALDAQLNSGVSNMARVGTFDRAGSIALRDGNEELARALWEYRCSLLQPQPRKHYVVMWSDAPILGPDSWKGLRVGETLMDRQYRRALSFIKTDISTGDRGVT